MTNRGKLSVSIRPVPDRADTLIALFSSPILASAFSVVFPDSITGALALHDFAEMLRLRYGKPVEPILDTDLFPMRHFRSRRSRETVFTFTRTVHGARPPPDETRC